MKLHRVELQHVRQFRRLVLDLSTSLTVIGGPNGVGKTTLQTAILAAMFKVEKKERDWLHSRFDPDSAPTATLELSRTEDSSRITLIRRLTDETGEWREGGTILKQRGKALEKVQGALPISADAAALLLWGLQEQMAAVVDRFPADGHTLLTAATICGAGPDPKDVIDQLEKDLNAAKRKGKNPGSLTQADERVHALEDALEKARLAHEHQQSLERDYKEARSAAEQAKNERDAVDQDVRQLAKWEKLLDGVLKAAKHLGELEQNEREWRGLGQEMAKAEKVLEELRREEITLEAQYRVAKEQELAAKIDLLAEQVKRVEEAQGKEQELQKDLESLPRPDKDDLKSLEDLKTEAREAAAGLAATGVRYELSLREGELEVKITEDAARPRTILLSPGEPRFGVVGNVEVEVDSLTLRARGKEDIGQFKRTVQRAETEIAVLVQGFGVPDEAGFRRLFKEGAELERRIDKARNDVRLELKGVTLASLKSELKLAGQERDLLNVAQAERDAMAGRVPRGSAGITSDVAGKRGEIKNALSALKAIQARQRTEAALATLQTELEIARTQHDAALRAFHEADPEQREPTEHLLKEIRDRLEDQRLELGKRTIIHANADREVTRLATDLKHTGPERPVATIEAEWREAKAVLLREQVFQEARELLRQQIESKIVEMTEGVPRDLGEKVTACLARISDGSYVRASLTESLAVSKVHERGQSPEHWEPHELSHGERHQAALALKIAVARAIVETSGPVFIILDDSLVHFDPQRRAATEELLSELVSDGKLQVILLTCHTDWAADWKRRKPDLSYIELAEVAEYYRTPVALASATD